jgi:epsin
MEDLEATVLEEGVHRLTEAQVMEMVSDIMFQCQISRLYCLFGVDYSGGGSTSRGGGSSFSDNRRQFEEYNAGDDEVASTPVRSNSTRAPPVRKATAPPPAPAPQPEVDLLGGFDDDAFSTPVPAPAVNKALPAVSNSIAGLDGMS